MALGDSMPSCRDCLHSGSFMRKFNLEFDSERPQWLPAFVDVDAMVVDALRLYSAQYFHRVRQNVHTFSH